MLCCVYLRLNNPRFAGQGDRYSWDRNIMNWKFKVNKTKPNRTKTEQTTTPLLHYITKLLLLRIDMTWTLVVVVDSLENQPLLLLFCNL